jgi:hypothetical protein
MYPLPEQYAMQVVWELALELRDVPVKARALASLRQPRYVKPGGMELSIARLTMDRLTREWLSAA